MRKYWRGIAIAGVVAVISGCGAASGSKNSINNGYIMETAAAAMDVENEKGEMSGEGASAFVDTAAGTASETENMATVETGRKLIRTASMDVETEQFEQLMTALKTQIRQFGGYIENEKYIVTWAVGHLIGLKMPEEHNPALKEWKMSTLPLIFDIDDSLKVLPDTKKQFEIVKKLIHRPDVDYLINAGDAGREGYLIQSWIYRYAGNRKPVKILWANSLTDEALRHAFANLKEEDIYFKNLLQEAEARAEADYLLGMNYSRVLTLTKSRDITLSYGRCQTPLLYLIVKRDQEIEQFLSLIHI